MTGNRRSAVTAVVPALVVLGLLVVVRAAATGPVAMFGTTSAPTATPSATPTATSSPTPSSGHALPTYKEVTRGIHASIDLSWLGQLIAYSALLAICWAVFVLIRSLWRNRWRRPDKPVEVAFELAPDAMVAEAVAGDAQQQLAAVERGGPRDGIVACWLRLEQVLASCGVEPRPAETSTELVTRVLQALDVDPRAVARLAALYREARFSEHPMGEQSRSEARAALRTLHQDLTSGAPA